MCFKIERHNYEETVTCCCLRLLLMEYLVAFQVSARDWEHTAQLYVTKDSIAAASCWSEGVDR